MAGRFKVRLIISGSLLAVAARALAADDVLRARLVGGLDLALLPAGATPPGEPFYVKE